MNAVGTVLQFIGTGMLVIPGAILCAAALLAVLWSAYEDWWKPLDSFDKGIILYLAAGVVLAASGIALKGCTP